MGILPPGDIRNCLAALVRKPSTLSNILHDRLPGEGTRGRPPDRQPPARGADHVRRRLSACRQDVERADWHLWPRDAGDPRERSPHGGIPGRRGDSRRKRNHGASRTHRSLRLERRVRPLPDAIEAIVNADLIVVGPGSLYTSILPNLLVDGIAATISGVTVPRVYVANLMTEPGETDGYSLS